MDHLGAILQGLFIIQIFAVGGFPSGVNEGEPDPFLHYAFAVPAFLAVGMRFFVLPRINGIERQIPAMVVALFLAEGTGIMGMFVVGKQFGQTQLILFVLSVVAVLSLAPIYIGKTGKSDPYQRQI